MHGTAFRQHGSNLKPIAIGTLSPTQWAIQNTANGYVSNARFNSSKEAQQEIDRLNGVHTPDTEGGEID